MIFMFVSVNFSLWKRQHSHSCFSCVWQLAWNPNLGSHHWLAVAGNAGLLRILSVRNVGLRDAAKQSASLFAAQSLANGAGWTTDSWPCLSTPVVGCNTVPVVVWSPKTVWQTWRALLVPEKMKQPAVDSATDLMIFSCASDNLTVRLLITNMPKNFHACYSSISTELTKLLSLALCARIHSVL